MKLHLVTECVLLLSEQAEDDAMIGEYPASLAPGQIMDKDDGPNWFFVVRHLNFPLATSYTIRKQITQSLQPVEQAHVASTNAAFPGHHIFCG